MGVYLNLADLIINVTFLGYHIEFSKFDNSQKINISKRYINSNINEYIISQVVPNEYLNNINKMEKLINFMMNKLDTIIIDKNENHRPEG